MAKPSTARLSKRVAESFEGSDYQARILSEHTEVYRGEGRLFGQYYGTVKPESAAHAEQLYNVVEYGNDLTTVSRYIIPKGTTVYEGRVAGGTGTQVFVPDPHAAGVRLMETTPLVQFGF